jgi:ABC-type transport system substrate-binding protein
VDKLEYENFEMIGSGPFKMAEYVQNEFVRLTANKEHFSTPPKSMRWSSRPSRKSGCAGAGDQIRSGGYDHGNAEHCRSVAG